MKLNSFKWWLLISINILMLITLTVTGIMAYLSALDELDEVYDAQLAHTARMLVILNNHALLENAKTPIEIPVPQLSDYGEELSAREQRRYAVHKYENKIAFQIWQDDRLLMRSQNAEHFKLSKQRNGYHEVTHDDWSWVTYSLYDPVKKVWVYTAQREDVREELSEELVAAIIRPLAFLFLPLSIVIYFIISLILKPIHNLSSQLINRNQGDLSDVAIRLPHELLPIKSAINQLLARIKLYLDKEKRFIADASHELRTPLAVMKIHAENLTTAESKQEQTQAAHAIDNGCKKMAHLVDQLLALANLESANAIQLQPVTLKELLESSLSQLSVEYLEQKQWSITVTGEVQVDLTLMQIALRNILENSAKYSPADNLIRIYSDISKNGRRQLFIQNSVTHTPEVERIEERFYRHRETQETAGSGLGLSIVKLIINLHGAEIDYRNFDNHFEVKITFKNNE